MAKEASIVSLVDLLSFLDSPSEPLFAKAMFGGHMIYCGEAALALVLDGTAYFKTDEANRPDYQKAGGEPFAFQRNGKEIVMSFWTPPAGSLDSEKGIRPWAESSLAAAKRALKKRKKRK